MPDALYRATKSDPDSKPRTGDTARSLGVRPRVDLPIDESGRVQPGNGGLSTAADDPRELPAHRRPKWLDGTGTDPIFKLRPILLPDTLTTRQVGRPSHYLIEPTDECLFTIFQCHLWSTRPDWAMIKP